MLEPNLECDEIVWFTYLRKYLGRNWKLHKEYQLKWYKVIYRKKKEVELPTLSKRNNTFIIYSLINEMEKFHCKADVRYVMESNGKLRMSTL